MSWVPTKLRKSGAIIFEGESQGEGGGSQTFAVVYLTLAANVAIDGTVILPFDTIVADEDGFWDATNHQFVVPTGKGGIYLVGASIDEVAHNNGDDPGPDVFGQLLATPQNVYFGLAAFANILGPRVYGYGSTSTPLAFADGDTVALSFAGSGAGTANVFGSRMWMQFLGPA